ncbi:MAG: hypothetical protein AABW89_03865 [Nanoarchaeota archaeon]
MTLEEIRACFLTALKEEEKDRKHKGLILEKIPQEKAEVKDALLYYFNIYKIKV